MLKRTRGPGPCSRFSCGALLAATAVLLSIVSTLACEGSGSDRLKALPPAVNPLAGDWHVTTSTSIDTCNLGQGVGLIGGHYTIQGSAAAFAVAYVPCPCPVPPWGTGTTDGAVVIMQSNRTVVSSSTCSWKIDEADAGTIDASGFSGGANLSVSAVGDCGTGFPCQIHGSFEAEQCPSTGCVMNCPLYACYD